MNMIVPGLVVSDYNKDNRDDLYCFGKDGTISVAESTVNGRLTLSQTFYFIG